MSDKNPYPPIVGTVSTGDASPRAPGNRRVAATLVQAADDVDAALGRTVPRRAADLTPGQVSLLLQIRPMLLAHAEDFLDDEEGRRATRALAAFDKLLRAHGIDPGTKS